MATAFDELWADALAKHFAVTDIRIDDGALPLLTTLDDLKNELSKRQGSFAEFREKKHALFDGMSKALQPIQMLAHIAAGGLSNAFPPSGIAFNAFNYMFAAAGNVSASYDAICDLLEDLGQFTSRLTIHALQDISPELRRIVIEILCALIRLCGYATKLIKRGRVSEYFKKLYLGKDDQIAAELSTLRRLTEAEARMVGALTLSSTNRTEKQLNSAVVVLSEVNVGVRDVNVGITELRDQMSSLAVKMNELRTEDRSDVEQKQLEKIRLGLSPSVTPEEIYRGISGKRVPGTGDWVHDERLFKAWLDRDKPILWISGGPGAGKSYLSSNIIQLLTHLHPQRVQASSRVSIAYYFCKDYDPELRSFNKALRTLAFQICQNDPVYAKYVAGVCSFPEDIRTTESLWQKLFVEFYSGTDKQNMVYILVDGMDEAFEQERATFLELLKSLQHSVAGGGGMRVQILLVGRPELSYSIEQVLEETVPTISVSAVKNSADIQQYVTTKVSKERNLRRISKALHNEIVTELTNRADGMFLWVDLMLKEISGKHKEIQMRQALQEAPQTLYDTIQHTMDRIHAELSEEDAKDFNTLLAWVTCARRPFKLGELESVLKFTSTDGESVVYLEGELRKRYASFFSVNREDGRSTEDLQTEHLLVLADEDDPTMVSGEAAVKVLNHDAGTVDDFGEDMDIDSDPLTTEITLSHASFGDYFRKHKDAGQDTTDVSRWNLQIVKHLLRMLCEKDLLAKWDDDSLSGYATAYWQDHLKMIDLASVSSEDRIEINQRLTAMFKDEETLITWAAAVTRMFLFRQTWIYTDENKDTVLQWLNSTSVQGADDVGVNILKDVVHLLAKAALTALKVDYPERSFMVMKAYQDKLEAVRTNAGLPKITDYEASDLAHNSADAIIEVARRFKFEENFIWNGRIARVLREAGHYSAARVYFQKAIDMAAPDDHVWRPLAGLAVLLSKQENFAEAVETCRRCLEALEEDESLSEKEQINVRSYYTTEMLEWCFAQNDFDTAISLGKEIMRSFPEQYNSATRYMAILGAKEKYATAMEILQQASQEVLEDKDPPHTRLADWCIEMMWRLGKDISFYDTVVKICRAAGDLELVKTAYVDAIKACAKTDSDSLFFLQADYATLLLRELHKPKKAAQILEKVLEESKASRKESASSYAKILVVDLLCEIYIARALKAGKGSKEATSCMQKLSKIWIPTSSAEDASDTFDMVFRTTRNSTMCLASLHRAFGEPDLARQLLREHVKLGLDLLTDDDPDNDWQGYFKLCDALARADDNINALAAYTMVTPKYISDEISKPDVPGEVKRLPVGSAERSWFSCDGDCGTEAEYGVEKFYNCVYCIDKAFCADCFKLLMEDRLSINVCGKNHEFLYAPEVEPFPKGYLPVDGKMVPLPEWLGELRKKWEL